MKALRISLGLAALLSLISGTAVYAGPGEIVNRISLDIKEPTGLAIVDNQFWVADRATGTLIQIDPETGKILSSIPSPTEQPLGLTYDGSGTLYIADDIYGSIYAMDVNTHQTRVVNEPETRPLGLAWDGQALWVTANRSLLKLDPSDGTEMSSYEASGRYPTGITFDGTYLWVAERNEDEIGVYTTDGTLFGLLPSPGPFPWGLARQGDLLYIVDYETRELATLSLTAPDTPYIHETSHHRTLAFTHEILNWGPDPLTEVVLAFCIPVEDEHQKLIGEGILTADPSAEITTVVDSWNQSFYRVRGTGIESGKRFSATLNLNAETWDSSAFILPLWITGLNSIPGEIRTNYTVDGSKLQIADPYIQKLAKEIVGNETNPFWIAWKIHYYLMTHMEYKLSGGWNVAPTILRRGNGSCSEFTISFLALARASGLPARYEAGFVVRGDDASVDNVYHRWVQVYLPPYGWVPVDSSMGKPSSARTIAREFGSRSNRFLITTHSGGDSPYLGWTYNSAATFTFRGRAKAEERTWAKWSPGTDADEILLIENDTAASPAPALNTNAGSCSIP
ncbi:MAG TPA: transglutaminase domain-containing protein [Thermoanaerobaculia bacterium]|nr:transglutaminase domain-containing protein [Thermoanaerobaculia bacterium]HUM29978.1 transglutaminase domain-containing protein [Thermoanaerobaculia bacterium]HXK68155.1 transglutaminase domain-containing protein [Thermoanaerobaculia bacterium]